MLGYQTISRKYKELQNKYYLEKLENSHLKNEVKRLERENIDLYLLLDKKVAKNLNI